VPGDVIDSEAVVNAIVGHDAVVSALGVGKPLKPDPVVVAGVQNIVDGMQASAVARLIYLSFIGVSDSRSAVGPLLRFAARVPLRHEIADHEAKEQLVSRSRLAWTIVRPPKLTNGRFTGTYQSGEAIATRSLLPTLSRADVADFIIRQLADPTYLRKVVRVLP
jgi:putative NADH-flavin reductase